MGQPVKLSDELILDARIAAAAMQRSIAGQVEFWARIGKATERILTGGQQANLIQKASTEKLLERLGDVDSRKGRARLRAYLKSQDFPRFWADSADARMYIREDADGTKTRGRFIGREFVPVETTTDASS